MSEKRVFSVTMIVVADFVCKSQRDKTGVCVSSLYRGFSLERAAAAKSDTIVIQSSHEDSLNRLLKVLP